MTYAAVIELEFGARYAMTDADPDPSMVTVLPDTDMLVVPAKNETGTPKEEEELVIVKGEKLKDLLVSAGNVMTATLDPTS